MVWTATPASLARLGVEPFGRVHDPAGLEASRQHARAGLLAPLPPAAPLGPGETAGAAHAPQPGDVLVLLTCGRLASWEHAGARWSRRLELLAARKFPHWMAVLAAPGVEALAAALRAAGLVCGVPDTAKGAAVLHLRLNPDPGALDPLLPGSSLAGAVVACSPATSLALTHFVERSAGLRAEFLGRVEEAATS